MYKALLSAFVITSLIAPVTAGAQLTSENFQVEGQSVSGDSITGNASSSNFDLDNESGGIYTIDTAPSTSGSGGGGRSGSSSGRDNNSGALGKGDAITICHSGNGVKYVTLYNVQVFIVLAESGLNAELRGHDGHDADIVPPFTYDFGDGVKQYAGNNWSPETELLYQNDCAGFLAEPEEPDEEPVVLIPPPVAEDPEPQPVPVCKAKTGVNKVVSAVDSNTVVTVTIPANALKSKKANSTVFFTVKKMKKQKSDQFVSKFVKKLESLIKKHGDSKKLPPGIVKKVASVPYDPPVTEPDEDLFAEVDITTDISECEPDEEPAPEPGSSDGPDSDGDSIPDSIDPDDNNDDIPDDPRNAIIQVESIVCNSESDLPNWGNRGGPNIGRNTATSWLANNPNCSFASGWEYQWSPSRTRNPGDNIYSKPGHPWITFGPTNQNGVAFTTVTDEQIQNNRHFWFRQVSKPDYVPFTFRYDRSSYSAELYCHTDVLNYDNFDRIDNIGINDTFFCISWNVRVSDSDDVPPVPDDVQPDSDSDGVPDVIDEDNGNPDADTDGDGIPDTTDPNPTTPDTDTDGDGVPDIIDTDDDNDGIPDTTDPNPTTPDTDTDGDGIPDTTDPNPTTPDTDTDGDGIPDVVDPSPDTADSDGDGVPDNYDDNDVVVTPDSDGDGIPDTTDPNPTTPDTDTDGDGLADVVDPDADGNSIPDVVDDNATSTDDYYNGDDVVIVSDTITDGLVEGVGDGAVLVVPPVEVTVNDEDGNPITEFNEPVEVEIFNPDLIDIEDDIFILRTSEDGETWFEVPHDVVDSGTVRVLVDTPSSISIWLLPRSVSAAGENVALEESPPAFTIPLDWLESRLLQAIAFLGTVFMSLYGLTKVPFSVSNIARMLIHLKIHLFGLITFRRKQRAWGTVYDSETKAPVDPAYVELIDESGKSVQQAITDLDGRYGFLTKPGTYQMKVRKVHYNFPSTNRKITGQDVLYNNLYYGGELVVENAVAYDIPMDPQKFDWNQYEKMRTRKTYFIHKMDPYIVRFIDLLSWIGLAAMIWQYYVTPSLLAGVLLAVYAVTFILRYTVGKPKLYGSITYKGKLLPYAVIQIYSGEREILSRVTDVHGRYVALVPKGNYMMRISDRVDADTYQTVFEGNVSVRSGVINRDYDFK